MRRKTKIASDEICDAAHEIAFHVDEAITMAVDAERERCIKIVQAAPVVVHTSLMERRRQLIALLRGR